MRHTPPLTAVWLAGLAVAVLLQSGHPSGLRIWLGRSVAAAMAVTAAGVLAGYLAGKTFGPPPRTAASVLYLSGAVALMRVDRRRSGLLWGIFLLAAVATPLATVVGHMFKAVSDVILTESTGQRISTAVGVLLLVAATVLARPDRNPIAWLLSPARPLGTAPAGRRPGRSAPVGGVSRLPFLVLGLGTEAAWILATTIATVIAGVAVFYLSQREQGLLIDKELLSRQRAEAEMRYRILADNAVDVVFHLHGSSVTWVSPSVEAAFGEPPPQWVGSDLRLRIHPDDLEAVASAVRGIGPDKPVLARFRVRTAEGGYHWVDGNAKPYLDADGNPDGLIAALRIVDDQVRHSSGWTDWPGSTLSPASPTAPR